MRDKESEYDYKFIYKDMNIENASFISKWGRRLLIMSVSAGIIAYQMNN